MIPLPDRLRADADTNTVSGDSGFSNEVMRDLQYTAALEREAADEIEAANAQFVELSHVLIPLEGESYAEAALAVITQRVNAKNRIEELERQLAEAKAEMRIALKCPLCEDVGWYAVNSKDGPEQQQCEFCYTTPNSLFNIRALPLESAMTATMLEEIKERK